MLLGNAPAGRSAGLNSFELASIRCAATHGEDDVPQRNSHRDLNQSGILDRPSEREHFRSLAAFSTERCKPCSARPQDRRHIRELLHVVDQRRLAEQSPFSWIWRPGTWIAPL